MSGLNLKIKGGRLGKGIRQNKKVFRGEDPLIAVLQWGLRHADNELRQIELPTVMLSDHFKANSKIKVQNHLFNCKDLPMKFKFKEYCPQVFRELRQRFHITEDDYLASTCGEGMMLNEEADSNGFYETGDHRLVIKTLKKLEVAQMHVILPAYYRYIVEHDAKTLLPQFMGMYRVSIDDKEHYITVMRNVMSSTLEIDERYDLKGSMLKRSADEKELAKEFPIFKDLDFRAANRMLRLNNEDRANLLERIERDSQFVASLNLMDYSFLVGIHSYDSTESHELNPNDVYAVHSSYRDEPEVYFMAIVDILTPYDASKRVAHTAKTLRNGINSEMSTVNPERYQKRFVEFIRQIMAQCGSPGSPAPTSAVAGIHVFDDDVPASPTSPLPPQ